MDTMQTEIYSVKPIANGHLYIMPCPGYAQVEQDLAHLQQMGIHKVVSLLEADEARCYGLDDEQRLCAALGMAFTQFPITDRQIPDTPDQPAFRQLIDQLYDELCSGNHIAIHCFAGIGRTGLLAGCILIKHGMTPAQATDLLSDTRGCHVPQTRQQYHYLLDYHAGTDLTTITTAPKSSKWISGRLSRWLYPA